MRVRDVLHRTWGDPAVESETGLDFLCFRFSPSGAVFGPGRQKRFRHQLVSDVFGHRAAHRHIDRLQIRVRSSAGHRRRLHLIDRVIE